MALSGACPGTLFVQLTNGIPSGIYAGIGGVLGSFLFTQAQTLLHQGVNTQDRKLMTSQTLDPMTIRPETDEADAGPTTIPLALNISPFKILLAYLTLCALIITTATVYAPTNTYLLSAFRGSALIALAQAMSLLLTRKLIGASAAYSELSTFISELSYRKAPGSSVTISTSAMEFAMGMMAGTRLVVLCMPQAAGWVEDIAVNKFVAAIGGVVMIFGTRVAGGCTSGHGISGMATFSVASFVTVGAMFAGGIGVRLTLDNIF